MKKLSLYAIGGFTVPSLLSFMSPNYKALQIAFDDQILRSEFITYNSPKGGGEIKGLLFKACRLQNQVTGNYCGA